MKKTNYLKIGFAIAALALALPVLGDDGSSTRSDNHPIKDAIQQIKTERGDLNTSIQNERTNFRASTSAERSGMRQQIETNRQDFQNFRKTASSSADVKAQFEQMRTENETLRNQTLTDIKAEREKVRSDIKNQILQFKDTRKVTLDGAKKERLNTGLNNAFQKLSDTLAKIQTYDLKIKDKITEDSGKGLDTSKAQADLVIAESALAQATTDVSGAQSGISDAVASSTSISIDAVRASVENAVKSIQLARSKFQIVINDLISIEGGTVENENASSTPENQTATTTS